MERVTVIYLTLKQPSCFSHFFLSFLFKKTKHKLQSQSSSVSFNNANIFVSVKLRGGKKCFSDVTVNLTANYRRTGDFVTLWTTHYLLKDTKY